MGSVHKFKRPPKNKRQFQGYQPTPSNKTREGASSRWRVQPWQKSVLAWFTLVLFAASLWLVGKLLGA